MKPRWSLPLVAAASVAALTSLGFSGAGDVTPAPRPADGVSVVLQAFSRTPLVAVGEFHGSIAEHNFLRQLISAPRFSFVARNIVVEFGNARYQKLMDQFISGGHVSLQELRVAWEQTTQRNSPVWDAPIYRQFFVMVRALNSRLPAQRKIRVLLGDAPIDWRKIRPCNTPAVDWRKPECIDYWYQRRDSYFASVVRAQVLAKGQTALLIAGTDHFYRPPPKNAREVSATLIGVLERGHARRVFIVMPYRQFVIPEPRVDRLISSWPAGSIATIGQTWVGNVPAKSWFGPDPPSTPQARMFHNVLSDGKLSDRFDAFLKLPA